jgi:hypothetical protein
MKGNTPTSESHHNASLMLEVEFASLDGDLTIAGTVRKPLDNGQKEKHPGLLLINGSGPLDRDGNSHGIAKMTLNTQNQLAEYATHHLRWITLSCDKRGVGKSVKKDDQDVYYRSGLYDLVNDAIASYLFLLQQPDIEATRMFVLGVSEGAIIIPLMIKELKEKHADKVPEAQRPFGVVLLSGCGESIPSATQYQRDMLKREVGEATGVKGFLLRRIINCDTLDKRAKDFEKGMQDLSKDIHSSFFGLLKQPAKWWREHLSYDAVGCLAHLECHVFAATGEKDVQTRAELCELSTLERMLPNAKSIAGFRVANMTHILRKTDSPASILNIKQEYSKQGSQPLDAELLGLMKTWSDGLLQDKETQNSG